MPASFVKEILTAGPGPARGLQVESVEQFCFAKDQGDCFGMTIAYMLPRVQRLRYPGKRYVTTNRNKYHLG